MMKKRPLPHDSEAEAALLGGLLLGGTTDPVTITADDFARESHGVIYSAIRALTDNGMAADAVTVKARLEREGTLSKVGGAIRLIECAETCLLSYRTPHYARIVADLSARRRLIGIARELGTRAYNDEGLQGLIADCRAQLGTEIELLRADQIGGTP